MGECALCRALPSWHTTDPPSASSCPECGRILRGDTEVFYYGRPLIVAEVPEFNQSAGVESDTP